jgi:hypothetical protein
MCRQGELLGSHVTTFCHPEDNVTRETILFYVAQPPPRSRVGPIFHTSPAGISKDRRVLRFHSRHQYFFSTTGRVPMLPIDQSMRSAPCRAL